MQLLNINKSVGDPLYTTEVMAIVGKINEQTEWINNYEAAHGTTTSIQLATIVGVRTTYTYTGQPVCPEFRLYMNGKLLEKGTDYDMYYDKNTDITSAAEIVITGIGNYSGSKTKTFAIEGAKYKLTYEANGHGTAPAAKNSVSSLTATDLTLPTDADFECTGWYTAATGGTKITAGYTLTADTTIYAQWQAKTFQLTYNVKGHGSVTQPTAKMEKLPELPTPTADDYWFLGWYYDESFTRKAAKDDKLTAATTLYAKWICNEVTATLQDKTTYGVRTIKVTLAKTETNANAVLAVNEGTGYVDVDGTSKEITLTATKTIKYKITYTETGVTKTLETEALVMLYDADETKITFKTDDNSAITLYKNGEVTTDRTFLMSSLQVNDVFKITDAAGHEGTATIVENS